MVLLAAAPLLAVPVDGGAVAGADQVVDASGTAACTVSGGQLVVTPGLMSEGPPHPPCSPSPAP